MKVIQAESAGFCYGVERAVDLARAAAKEHSGCVMLGHIIHNSHVVEELAALGVRKVDSVEEVREGETVIIRSHGEKKETFQRLAQLGATCLNATCTGISDEGVSYRDNEGNEHTIPADSVILAAGMRPNTEAAEAFRFLADEYVQIGDCAKIQTVFGATHTGYYAALDL